jgi:hypothetical protein
MDFISSKLTRPMILTGHFYVDMTAPDPIDSYPTRITIQVDPREHVRFLLEEIEEVAGVSPQYVMLFRPNYPFPLDPFMRFRDQNLNQVRATVHILITGSVSAYYVHRHAPAA